MASTLKVDTLEGQSGSGTSVTITGGTITGITDLAVADGGTGASTAAGARTALGLTTIATATDPLPVAQGGTGSASASAARTALDVPSNAEAILDTLVSTTGDIIYASSANTPARLAIGTAGTILMVNAGATAPAWTSQNAMTPRSYLAGCTISNGTDATNDIDIAAGVCRDSTNTVTITVAAMTGKQLDANWAAGSSAGMRNSGAAITNTTYHIYAVSTATGTQDIYAHTSTTVATVITALQAESGGSAYIYARRIGSILRESAAITGFKQRGDYFALNAPALDITVANPGTSAATRTLRTPAGIVVFANLALGLNQGLDNSMYVSALDSTDQAPHSATHIATNVNDAFLTGAAGTCTVKTDTSSAIRTRCSADVGIYISLLGWTDTRGRDD